MKNIVKEHESNLGIKGLSTQILFNMLTDLDTLALTTRLDRLLLAIAIY